MTGGSKPANHIPTSAPCTQCHTTANNYALYSVTGTHQGVSQLPICHAPRRQDFRNVTIASTTTTNHIPIGTLDCNGSGCHTTANVTPAGSASVRPTSTPDLERRRPYDRVAARSPGLSDLPPGGALTWE